MDDFNSEWQSKRATLSDKTARKEFGLTQDEILHGIRTGMLHCREGSMHGNPWLRLLRREVEALVREKHGKNYLKNRQAQTELAHINRELKRLKAQIARLEERKSNLTAGIGGYERVSFSKAWLDADPGSAYRGSNPWGAANLESITYL